RADPPDRIGREANVLARVEVLDRFHQPDVSLLNQVVEAGAAVGELLRDRDHESEVGDGEQPAGRLVTLAGAPGELVLLLAGQLRVVAQVAKVRREILSGKIRGSHDDATSFRRGLLRNAPPRHSVSCAPNTWTRNSRLRCSFQGEVVWAPLKELL